MQLTGPFWATEHAQYWKLNIPKLLTWTELSLVLITAAETFLSPKKGTRLRCTTVGSSSATLKIISFADGTTCLQTIEFRISNSSALMVAPLQDTRAARVRRVTAQVDNAKNHIAHHTAEEQRLTKALAVETEQIKLLKTQLDDAETKLHYVTKYDSKEAELEAITTEIMCAKDPDVIKKLLRQQRAVMNL